MAEPGDIVCQEQGWRGGGGGLINFPPLKRGRLFERGAQKRICNLIIICKTLKKEGRAFRNISKNYIYSQL